MRFLLKKLLRRLSKKSINKNLSGSKQALADKIARNATRADHYGENKEVTIKKEEKVIYATEEDYVWTAEATVTLSKKKKVTQKGYEDKERWEVIGIKK